MARPRRGRSRGPEVRGTLGTLLRTTLAQAGAVREVLQRGAREGRARLDDARSSRRRDLALADLGELVIELVDRGLAPELEDRPEVRAALDAIAEFDAVAEDDRGGRRRPGAGRAAVTRDDGAVSSRTWRPPPAGKDASVWRPTRDAGTAAAPAPAERVRARDPAREPGAVFAAKDGPRRGGISFDGDDDLDNYMHPDDVPGPDKK